MHLLCLTFFLLQISLSKRTVWIKIVKFRSKQKEPSPTQLTSQFLLFGICFVRQKTEEGYLEVLQAGLRAANQRWTPDQQVVDIINLHNPKISIFRNI